MCVGVCVCGWEPCVSMIVRELVRAGVCLCVREFVSMSLCECLRASVCVCA